MRLLRVLYQDDHYIAINKPAGLLVHRSEIDRSERRFALQLLRNQIGQHVYPIHRLDKPTAGVLLFGLSSEAASRAQLAFRQRQVQKEYLAVCRGYLPDSGVIDHPLSDNREKMERGEQERPPQAARTRYECLGTTEMPYPVGRYPGARYSLLKLIPETGRKHQLRRHLKHLSHPIVGDTRYGDGKHNRLFRDQFNSRRLLLFAVRLQLVHPFTGEPLCIESPLPKAMRPLFGTLNLPQQLPPAAPLINNGEPDDLD
ncbi:pseudouridine synthase [Motiliproteus sediminis]|uniref:pseudouridine synthase n=1 Tax=Motiliproteus sediminis TaxID=1468178 RepID=UPI001AEF3EA6|nr:pseudouridine synthase [Motiliproteus sediminis]